MKRKGPEPKEQRRKKPKDMPRRPLSAYNLFFRAEREIIMDKYERGEEQADFQVPHPPKKSKGEDGEDGHVDPKLVKSHNAAVFQAVARTIADRAQTPENQVRRAGRCRDEKVPKSHGGVRATHDQEFQDFHQAT